LPAPNILGENLLIVITCGAKNINEVDCTIICTHI